jgi:pyrophosphatase PpaX
MRYPVVLFDLDGTLIDSGAMILASMRHAAKTVLARDCSDAELLATVGGSGLREQMQALDPERVEELVDAYRLHNEPLHEGLECCAGIEEMLAQLSEEGRRLGIVTAKRRATVELAFEVLPIARYFDAVVTAEQTERHKPHPEPLLRALELLDAARQEAVYIGDSPFDVAAAKAVGIAAIAVGWGGIHARERLLAEGPDAYVETVEDLLAQF